MDYRLPNGTTIKGLPEGYTPDQIKTIAINGGYATEQDYQQNRETGADWATTVGEIGGGVAGSYIGGALGTALLPGPGTAAGMVLGGALGTFFGSLGGQAVESALEDRQLDPNQQLKLAAEAAAVDTAFGFGFSVIGKGIKAIAQPLMRLAPTQATTAVDTLLPLQERLGQFGSTLLPSQMGSATFLDRGVETYAASSVAFRPEYDRIVKGYDDYVKSTAFQLLNKLPNAPRVEIGKAFSSLHSDIQKAVDEVVDPLYKDIDARGNLVLSATEIQQRMVGFMERTSAGGINRPSSKAQTIMNMVSRLPETMTPAQMAADLPQILTTARKLAEGDAQAAGLFNILNTYVNKVRTNPALIDTSAISGAAKGERLRRVSEDGKPILGGAYGEAVNYVGGLRRKMSFSEARQELSFLKSKLRDMENPASPDSTAAKVYASAVSNMEKSMEAAAKNFDTELYGSYRFVSDFYKRSQETVFSPFMREALQNNEPAKVGDLLATTGYVTPVRELDEMLALADELGVENGKNLRGQITRSYLEGIFKTADAKALNSFNRDMMNPNFRDTFMAVVPKDTANQITQLAQEAEILARHTTGGPAASLSVASREIGALESPGKLRSLLYFLLPLVVKGRLSNKVVTAKLNAIKVVNEQLAAGKPPSTSALAYLVDGLPQAAMAAGITAGAAATPQ